MTKRSSFKSLLFLFLLIIIAGATSLNFNIENTNSPQGLHDDIFTEQSVDNSSTAYLLSLSNNCLRISHFNNLRHPIRNFNRTLNNGAGLCYNNNFLTTAYNGSKRKINKTRGKYSSKIYFLYALQRINI